MELYLLKSVGCLAILFIFYKAVLEHESFHNFKRWFLLGSLVAAFLIPLVTLTQYVEIPAATATFISSEGSLVITEQRTPNVPFLLITIWAIYGAGLLFFGLKFFRNLNGLVTKIRKNPNVKNKNLFHVLLQTPAVPHTFLQYIFLNKTKFEKNEIPAEVLLHEEAHAVQKHSIDILFIELLQVIFWFNPLLYFMKHSIKLNHEFLADQAVLEQGVETSRYQNILLAFSSSATTPTLANSINYSSTRLNELFSKKSFGQVKKRFTVMKNQTSKRSIWLRSLILLPLLAVLIYGFSSKKTVAIEKTVEIMQPIPDKATPEQVVKYNSMARYWNNRFEETNKRIMPLDQLKELETLYRTMDPNQKTNAAPFPHCDLEQTSATRDEMREYNELAKKYNNAEGENLFIRKKDVDRLTFIHDKMSSKQRTDAEPFPNFPPPPPAPDAPKPPKVKKGELSDIPPPPPPPAPDAPKPPKVKKGELSDIPPPPPPPPAPQNPLDHIIILSKKGASFYYEGKKVSSDKAIDLLKKNKDLNVQISRENSKNPQVKITTKPIYLDTNKQTAAKKEQATKDAVAEIKNLAAEGAHFLLFDGGPHFPDGQKITSERAIEIIKKVNGLTIDVKDAGYIYKIVEIRMAGC